MPAVSREAKKKRRGPPPPDALFLNQLTESGDVEPGAFLEIRFRPPATSTVLVVAAERNPSIAAVLDQDYCVELFDGAQEVPVARKESLRGVVITSLTHGIEQPDGEWAARLTNTGAHRQLLTLLVSVA